jgi:regulator of sigma E protease
MSVILFIIILAILVFVHELGHFLVAKKSGIKVSEFGLGFPPRVWGKQVGETLYSINAIPFGGFVKILGEDSEDEAMNGPEKERSILAKPKYIQVAVLAAGVFFNLIFAWFLISAGYMVGLPTPVDHTGPGTVTNAHLVLTLVAPGSPAEAGKLKAGDVIVGVHSKGFDVKNITGENVSEFIQAHGKDGLTFEVKRGSETISSSVTAKEGIIPDKVAVGISMDMIGTLRLSPPQALWEGLKTTEETFVTTAQGLFAFISQAVQGKGKLSEVTGPVGIVGIVGDVTKLGFVYLLSFTAIISINLAVINLFPFPALDGGRILFVLIEAIMRKPISPKVANILNTVGFALLILLMIVVTVHDISKLW